MNERETESFPSVEEVREIVAAICKQIDRNPPLRIDKRFAEKPRTTPLLVRPPIRFSQAQIDEAKLVAAQSLEKESISPHPAISEQLDSLNAVLCELAPDEDFFRSRGFKA